MKFAKKFVLVPGDRYEQMQHLLLNKENEKIMDEDTSPGMQQQQGGGGEEGSAMASPTIPPAVPEHGSNGGSQEVGDASKPEQSSDSRPLEDQHIIDSVGKKFRSKTFNLLAYVRKVSPKEMTWNNKGEITYKGNHIAGSNIIDLMRSAMHNVSSTLTVPGSSAFQNILHELNVPITLIGNNNWRTKLQDLKAGRPVQVTTSKPLRTKSGIVKKKVKKPQRNIVKWISL